MGDTEESTGDELRQAQPIVALLLREGNHAKGKKGEFIPTIKRKKEKEKHLQHWRRFKALLSVIQHILQKSHHLKIKGLGVHELTKKAWLITPVLKEGHVLTLLPKVAYIRRWSISKMVSLLKNRGLKPSSWFKKNKIPLFRALSFPKLQPVVNDWGKKERFLWPWLQLGYQKSTYATVLLRWEIIRYFCWIQTSLRVIP